MVLLIVNKREINGNTPHHNAKRKTNHRVDRRHTTGPVNFKYNNNNITPSYNNFDPNLSSLYYPPNNNQNMFPAISDPSLCYPIMNYPYEPLSLPNYNNPYNIYRNHNHCPPPPPNYFKHPHLLVEQQQPSPVSTNYFKTPQMQATTTTEEFTSLPVVNGDLNDDDNKRRFSDPGGVSNDCDGDDGGGDTEDDHSKNDQVVQCLIEQVNYLKDSNRRLFRELQDMRSEMNFLKQQFGIRFYDKEYEPGMLSDVVREIRDAARIREETLLSKVKHEVKNMIEERQMTVNHLQLVAEKTRNNDRLGKLEDQMKSLCLSNRSLRGEDNSIDTSASTDQVLELEQVNLELRRELQEARAGKKDADAKIIHLDQMLSSFHQKYANGDVLASIDDAKTSSSIDNCSLATKSSAASPVARVVMSGPVTSL